MRQRPEHAIVSLAAATLLLAGILALPCAPARGETADEALAACQKAYDDDDLVASQKAALEAITADPGSYPAHWMLARVLIDIGNRTEDKDARQKLYEDAEARARQAVNLDPNDTWGHHYLAASVGKLALLHGGKTKIELSKEVRDEALRAIELDPKNDLSLHIMGRWERNVATLGALKRIMAKVIYGGVPEGSLDEAVDYFKRAIAINPGHVNHHLELGKTYMDMREYELAAEQFRTCLELQDRDPNAPHYKEEAQDLLKKAERRIDRPREDKSR